MGRPRSDDRLMLNGIFWIRFAPPPHPGAQQILPLVQADKSYDAEHLCQYCDRYRIQPEIPQRTMKRKPKPRLPGLFDRPRFRQRNIIEPMFGWLKVNRRVGTRYDKLARNFAVIVTLTCMPRCLRQYF